MNILMISDVYFPRINGVSTSIETFRSELTQLGVSSCLVAPTYPQGPEPGHQDVVSIPSRFLPLDLFGGALWIFSLTLAGYWFGNLPWIKANLTVVIFGIIGISLLPLVVSYLRAKLGSKQPA